MLRLIATLVAVLPWRWLGAPGALLGWLAGSALRVRRTVVDEAMARAGVARSAAPAMYAGLGRGLFELFWLAGARAERRDGVVGAVVELTPRAQAALDEALSRGPVVLAASHTGNWELVAFAAARALRGRGERRLAVVAKPLSVGPFDAFCKHLREAAGLVLLSPRGAFGAARRALARGDVVAMPIDQVPDAPRHALRAPFLGQSAHCDRAPATLAWRAGATILVVAARRAGAGDRHVVDVLAALDPRAAAARGGPAWIAEATGRATAALDAFVREEPAAWLWLHRRWRAPSPARAGRALRLVASAHPG